MRCIQLEMHWFWKKQVILKNSFMNKNVYVIWTLFWLNLVYSFFYRMILTKLTAHQAQIIVHESSDGELKIKKKKSFNFQWIKECIQSYNSRCIDSCSDNFQTNLVFSSDYNILLLRFVARWISVWTKLHIRRDGLKNVNKFINMDYHALSYDFNLHDVR